MVNYVSSTVERNKSPNYVVIFLFIKVHDKRAHNTPNLSRNLDARNPSQFAFVRQIWHL